MAEIESGESPMVNVLWLLFFLGVVFVAWFATGGPQRADLNSLLLQSPVGGFSTSTIAQDATSSSWFPISYPGEETSTGHTTPSTGSTGAFADVLTKLSQFPSPARDNVSFSTIYGVQATSPEKEFIELQASSANTASISISGWRIQSLKTGRTAVIGTAIETPLTGSSGTPGAIVLAPGERAIISSGRSPIGVSFRVNACSGYLAQFQSFTPTLTPQCPAMITELYNKGSSLTSEQACVSVATAIPPCKVLTAPPSGVSYACSSFLTRADSYNGCVGMHKNDPDFRQNEWRIYEGNASELWAGTGDALVLFDQQGRLVSSTSY